MANHFSAMKRVRQTERRTARNRANRSRLRGELIVSKDLPISIGNPADRSGSYNAAAKSTEPVRGHQFRSERAYRQGLEKA